MSYDQSAMAAFAEQVITDCNGRMVTPTGESLNVDGRYGWQCMDLFIYIRYHLGFRDNLPTPDAASVWEMNWTHPDSTMWTVFDGITPDRPCYPGDIGIMNRQFFNNGVGHIFMIVADLGQSIRVLELNGLGDGREDENGNQYGSPARIHDWPKTYLYGYLRWIGPAPAVSAQSGSIIPIQEADVVTQDDINAISTAVEQRIFGHMIANRQIPGAPPDTFENWASFTEPRIYGHVHNVANGLVPIAQALGDLKNRPTTPAPTIDIPALATQIAAVLNKDQAHQLLVELGKSLPTQ